MGSRVIRLDGFLHFLVTGEPISAKQTECVRREISFREAIDAHLAWKRQLVESLKAPGRAALVPLHVGNASLCVLGGWIDGAGERRYGDLSSFAELRDIHRRFHVLARRVVELQQANDRAAAQALLATEFEEASLQIVERLRRLSRLFGS